MRALVASLAAPSTLVERPDTVVVTSVTLPESWSALAAAALAFADACVAASAAALTFLSTSAAVWSAFLLAASAAALACSACLLAASMSAWAPSSLPSTSSANLLASSARLFAASAEDWAPSISPCCWSPRPTTPVTVGSLPTSVMMTLSPARTLTVQGMSTPCDAATVWPPVSTSTRPSTESLSALPVPT